MKSGILSSFFILSFLPCSSQWLPVDTINWYWDCLTPRQTQYTFVDSSTAFLVTSRSTCTPSSTSYFVISRTTNSFHTIGSIRGCGGALPNYGELYDMDLLSRDTVYLYYTGCLSPKFERTTDGGLSWTTLPPNRPADLSFIHSRLGYGFQGNGYYRLFDDSLQFINSVSFLTGNYKLHTLDSSTALVVVYKSSIQFGEAIDQLYRTGDAGQTWQNISLDPSREFGAKPEIMNSSLIWLRADSGYYYKSIDGGETWIMAMQNSEKGDIHFLSETKAYSLTFDSTGTGSYHFTKDAGLTWESNNIGIFLSGGGNVRMLNDSVGYIHSIAYLNSWIQDIILKTVNGGRIVPPPANPSVTIFPNPNTGSFTVQQPDEVKGKTGFLKIYNALGGLVYSEEGVEGGDELHVDIPSMRTGLFFVTLEYDGNRFITKLIVF